MDNIVQTWLDRYLVAWRSNDPDDIRALFTEDATYARSPLDTEPWVGRDNIVTEWRNHRDEIGDWAFEGAPLVYSDGVGIIQGQTDYSDGSVYANIWVVRFADDGRAESFVEWWMKPAPGSPE